jgi:hypothetical protein
MKTKRKSPLQAIPNVGPCIAEDLERLGIKEPQDLEHRDPDRLYEELCFHDGVRHDPCVRDVFAAAVAYARGEPARPWWHFSRLRKERARRGSRSRARQRAANG